MTVKTFHIGETVISKADGLRGEVYSSSRFLVDGREYHHVWVCWDNSPCTITRADPESLMRLPANPKPT